MTKTPVSGLNRILKFPNMTKKLVIYFEKLFKSCETHENHSHLAR
nr:MAG TPA: hypothetical protein [Caudoviricetes sp.]